MSSNVEYHTILMQGKRLEIHTAKQFMASISQ